MALEKNESQRQVGAAQERGRRDREWAGEVHDTLIQYFNGIIRSLEGLEKAVVRNIPKAAAEARVEAQQTAREGLAEARGLVSGRGPRSVPDGTLPESLSVAASSVLRGAGIGLEVEVYGEPKRLSEGTEHDLLRVAQEAIQNIVKHSGASRAQVLLRYGPATVTLEVSDDGTGLRPRPPDGSGGRENRPEGLDGGFGLRNMCNRVEAHRGSLRFEHIEGGGTRIVAEVPV